MLNLELTEERQALLHKSLIVPESSTGARMMLCGRRITLREQEQEDIYCQFDNTSPSLTPGVFTLLGLHNKH